MKAASPAGGPRPGHLARVVGETRQAVRAALIRSNLGASALVVAVSGGQDSMALLDALNSLAGPLHLRLICAHYDHQLRGEESLADAEFVSRHCSLIGVKCVVGRSDSPATAAGEAAARERRYGFLGEVAENVGAAAVAVGHSAADQAETVILNLMRGAGLSGLSAMRVDSMLKIDGRSIRVIRPLLSVSRVTLGDYCAGVGITPRVDSSNLEENYTRNRVRQRLMPLMRTFNPAVEDSLARLAASAAQSEDFIEAEAGRCLGRYIAEGEGSVSVGAEAASLHPAIASALLRRAVEMVKGDLADVRKTQVDQLISLLKGGSGSASVAGGVEAVMTREALVISRASPPAEEVGPPTSVPVPGSVTWSGWSISASIAGREDGGPGSRDRLLARLDPALADGEIWVRGWRGGDRIQPLGMTGTKKLKDLFVESKVPGQERPCVPLLVTPRGIAWVAGCRIAEWAKVPAGADRLLTVRVTRVTQPSGTPGSVT